jgi:hypothetical protein
VAFFLPVIADWRLEIGNPHAEIENPLSSSASRLVRQLQAYLHTIE